MKLRNGFVSNSSSSSFVVVFPREPKSCKDVQDILFDKNRTIYASVTTNYNTKEKIDFTTAQAALTVWNDIKRQKRRKNQIKIAKKVIRSGYIDDPNSPDLQDFIDHKASTIPADFHDRFKRYNQAQCDFADTIFNERIIGRKMKLKTINNEPIEEQIYTFGYSDEDGSYGSALEHNGLFKKLRHVRISHH